MISVFKMGAVACGMLACSTVFGCDQADPGDPYQANDGVLGNQSGTGGTGAAGNGKGGGTGATGGSGGATGGAGAPDTGDTGDVSAAFYPYVAGARWTYRHSSPQNPAWDEDVTFDVVDYQGRSAMLQTDTPGPSGSQTRSFYEREGTEVRRFHKEVMTGGVNDSVVDYVPGFTRFDEAWPLMPVGSVETRGYTRTEVAPDGTTLVDMRVQRYTVEQTNVMQTVPAGTFSGCVVIFRERLAPDGGPPVAADVTEKRFTFCPGVGKVREENMTDGGLEELVSCAVPGGGC